MTERVSEALLEMVYFEPLRQLFVDHYGRSVTRILKPSTKSEAFYGFDQGWVFSGQPHTLEADLKQAIAAGDTRLQDREFVGFFLQFKRADVVRKTNRANLPSGLTSPYIRFPLDLSQNRTTGRSQHETLLRLSNVLHADVSYACPMLIYADDVLAKASLDTLRIVPISSAPAGYATNQKHHIVFQNRTSVQAHWCSEPQESTVLTPQAWLSSLRNTTVMGAEAMLTFLKSVAQVMAAPGYEFTLKWEDDRAPKYPECLTIVELGPAKP